MNDYYVIRDEDYLSHHGVKGQKWGVRKDDDKKKDGLHLKITPGLAVASGAAFLAAGGATLLARKIAKGSFVPGGFVVEKGVRGIHYSADVGKAVTNAVLAGGVGAMTVSSIKTIKDSTKKGD